MSLKTFVAAIDGKKTYIVAVVSALYALLVLGWGQSNWNGALQVVIGFSGTLTGLRSALAKIEKVLQAINSNSNVPASDGSQQAPVNQ